MRFIPIPLLSLLAWCASPVMANESFISPGMENKEATDSIAPTLERRDALDDDPARKPLFVEYYRKIRTWREEMHKRVRLETIYSYDTLAQGYSDPDSSQGASSADATFSARWLMFGHKHHRPAYLSFRMRHRHAYSDLAPSEISSNTGLLWGTVDGFTNAGFQVPEFNISQELADGRLTLRYGQFSVDSYFDTHSLRSAKRYFLNRAFSANPTIGFPGYGAGFTLLWKSDGKWDLSLGGSNMQGTDQSEQINLRLNLNSSALFYTIQGGYNFQGLGEGDARIQLMAWQNQDNNEDELPDGSGVSLTFEHEGASRGERYVARYAFSGGDATTVDQLFMLGWGREIRKYDHIGAGFGLGRSAGDNSTWQGVGEIYYRWQATRELVITPDLQIILGEGEDTGNAVHVVAGVRAGITF